MSTRDRIFEYIKKHDQVTGRELIEKFKISRQALNKHLKILIENKQVYKNGETKNVVYSINSNTKNDKNFFRKRVLLKKTSEDLVFENIKIYLNLEKRLLKNVLYLVNYAFTEILNNAIEHSYSEYADIEFNIDTYKCSFIIRDRGIGVFESIKKKFKLLTEIDSVRELLKGKATTIPERHSGEGLFFSSKVSDNFKITSHKIELFFESKTENIIINEIRFFTGTKIFFEISKRSRKNISDIFNKYAPSDYDYKFDKTKVFVYLSADNYISRSEARRILFRLTEFKEIVLDFKKVKQIGQAFADEIFRVFRKNNPDIIITVENASPIIDAMIQHVSDNE